MPAIATLTLNPALDLSTSTERVEHTSKLRCGQPRYDPGGGGINVARAVKILGGEVVAIYPAGGPAGAMLRATLDAFGLDQRVIPIAGITRENFTIDEAETGNQYRFILPGPPLSAPELRQCLDAAEALQPRPSYLVVSGGYPPDVAAAELSAEITRLAKRMGARLVFDTSQSMRDAPEHGVFLMKPSLSELGWMTGRAHATCAEQIEAARSLIETGRAVVVVVSLGADGALLVTDTLAEHFPTPEVPMLSAVGAGDSMVGAIVLALCRGWNLTDAVRYGVAAGAATIMTPGTEMCHPEDVERLFNAMSAIPEAARV